MNTLEGFVAAFLAENRMQKQELADLMGCSLVTLNRRIGGESEMTISFARKLADAMDVNSDTVCRLAP